LAVGTFCRTACDVINDSSKLSGVEGGIGWLPESWRCAGART
jgi:hypothetical protein